MIKSTKKVFDLEGNARNDKEIEEKKMKTE